MKRRRPQLNPDLTSLIDVVFLLLIFFVAVSTIEPKKRMLSLELPQIESLQVVKKQENYLVELSESTIALDGKPIDATKKLTDFLTDSSRPIELHAEKMVPYERVAKVLAELQERRFTKINLIVNEQ